MVYIIVGMLLCFFAIFIILAYLPSGAFDWLFRDPSESSGSSDDQSSQEEAPEPGRNRL